MTNEDPEDTLVIGFLTEELTIREAVTKEVTSQKEIRKISIDLIKIVKCHRSLIDVSLE